MPTNQQNALAPGMISGDMDTEHLSSLQGASVSKSASQLILTGFHSSLILTGDGLVYDSHSQLIGGSITHFSYSSQTLQLNVVVPGASASSLGAWITADATPTAFAAVLSGSDEVHGSLTADLLRGYGGDDTLYGAGGGDSLFGGDGRDRLFADNSPSSMTSTHGSYLRGEDGDDSIQGAAGFDDINGNLGDDSIDGGSGGGDWLLGGQGADMITAHGGHNLMNGNLGADTLLGGNGGDTLRGGQGDDSLVGGSGADWISGDLGNDVLKGGAGADTFNFVGGAGLDRVLDFNVGEGDRVVLAAGETYTFTQVGADTVIDLRGDQLILVGVNYASLTGLNWIATQ